MNVAKIFATSALLLATTAPLAAQTIEEAFARVSHAVAIVHTSSTAYPLGTTKVAVSVEGTGSAVLISPTEVMTAAHVVQTADEVVLEFPNGEIVRARVIASRPTHDVALLELAEPVSVEPVTIGDSDAISIGEQVFVVGAPLGEAHTLTAGYLSARRNPVGRLGGSSVVEYLQTDAAINPGNSGGPMFNLRGEVIGIVSHILTMSGGFQGLGYAVAANTARRVLLEEPGLWSGLAGTPLIGLLAELFNIPPPGSGILVQSVAAGSLAESMGLRPSTIPIEIAGESMLFGGDIILSAQGIPLGAELERWDEVRGIVAALPAGSQFSLTVLRGGKILRLNGSLNPGSN